MNPFCKFCMDGSSPSGNKCAKGHEKLPLKLAVEYPVLDSEAAAATCEQVQQTPTVESTIEQTTALEDNNSINAGQKSNKLKKTTKKQLERDLKALRNENAKLNGKIVTLGTTTNTLTKQLNLEKNKNAIFSQEFNIALLNSEDLKCSVCCELFIRPSLLSCSHMLCEWCIDRCLEQLNHCPLCRVMVISYTYCLSIDNFIKGKMQLMPENIRLEYRAKEVARARDKETSRQLQAERRRLERITLTLNGNRSN